MPLQRFHRFDQATVADPSGLHPLALETHGPQESAGFVQRFVQQHWKKAVVGLAAGAALTLGAAGLGTSVIGPHVQDGSAANTVYQAVEQHLHGDALRAQQHAIEGVLQHARAVGILSVVPQVQLSYYNAAGSSEMTTPNGGCVVHLHVDEHGRMMDEDLSGTPYMFDDATGHEHRDSVAGHEASHCEFEHVIAPFRHSGLSATAEQAINNWVIGPGASDNPLRSEFNETQADLLGKMIMLEENHFSPSAWDEVRHAYASRQATQAAEESGRLDIQNDPHNTAPGLRLLLEHRQEVERLAPAQYRDFAYGLASRSLLENLDGQRIIPDLNGPGHPLGADGYTRLSDQMNLFGLRSAVVEQVLQVREEQLGLRVHRDGIESTLPRQLAEEWLRKDNPFVHNPVTFVQRPDGSIDRRWASPETQDRFVDDPGPLQMRDHPSLNAVRAGFHWSQVAAELSQALHTPNAAAGMLAATGSTASPVDKPVPAVTMGTPITVRPPSLNDLGARLDARTAALPTPGAVPTVSRPWSRSP